MQDLREVKQPGQDSLKRTGEFLGSTLRFPCLRSAGPNQLCARTRPHNTSAANLAAEK